MPASKLKGYLDRLWRVVWGRGNYTAVLDSRLWRMPPRPHANETVKVASWRL